MVKNKGWKGESHRHSLAAKGIKTANKRLSHKTFLHTRKFAHRKHYSKTPQTIQQPEKGARLVSDAINYYGVLTPEEWVKSGRGPAFLLPDGNFLDYKKSHNEIVEVWGGDEDNLQPMNKFMVYGNVIHIRSGGHCMADNTTIISFLRKPTDAQMQSLATIRRLWPNRELYLDNVSNKFHTPMGEWSPGDRPMKIYSWVNSEPWGYPDPTSW